MGLNGVCRELVENSTVDCAERKARARILALAMRAAFSERFHIATSDFEMAAYHFPTHP